MSRKKKKKPYLIVVGILLIGFLIIKFDFTNVLAIMMSANPLFLLIGIILYVLGLSVRAMKWHLCIRQDIPSQKVSLSMILYHINNSISTVTPFRSGELYGPVLINRNTDISIGAGLNIVVLDRILEMLFLVIMLIVSFLSFISTYSVDQSIITSAIVSISILIIILCGLGFAIFFKKPTMRFINWLMMFLINRRVQKVLTRIESELKNFYLFQNNYSNLILFKLGLLTILGWIFIYLSYFYVIYSIVPVKLFESIISQTISFGIGLISMIPAGLGIGAVSFTYINSVQGYPQDALAAASILAKFLFMLLVFLSGFISSISKEITEKN